MTSYTKNFQNFTCVFTILVKFDIYFFGLPWKIHVVFEIELLNFLMNSVLILLTSYTVVVPWQDPEVVLCCWLFLLNQKCWKSWYANAGHLSSQAADLDWKIITQNSLQRTHFTNSLCNGLFYRKFWEYIVKVSRCF